jgi:hypothetical protein
MLKLKTYSKQKGDVFYGPTGIIPGTVVLSPDKKSKTFQTFNPYQGPSNRHFCPQAAERGESDGDTGGALGYVSNPAALKGETIRTIKSWRSRTADPYDQGDVALCTDGSTLTIPNIGWPEKV